MQVKITIMKKANYDDLIAEYESPTSDGCSVTVGSVFYTNGTKPQGLCQSAWETICPFVSALLRGEGNFYGDWMKNGKSAMLSCNDGFRPVTFLVELTG